MVSRDTIAAVSSGSPPAAIGVIRVSGPHAGAAIDALCGRRPEPRKASLRTLRDTDGLALDEALVLWFPGPATATGEDLAEFHCHGGRAVLAAVEHALVKQEGVRRALPGEFTRRAFANGRVDLAEAEGLADLLTAETELQRATAMANAGGAISRQVEAWREEVLRLSAQVEAALDFADEDDVAELSPAFVKGLAVLSGDLRDWLNRPRVEALGQGYRVALAGPPNAGKSTLFNALVDSEAAITSPIAGTTRDVIERSVAISGTPFTFVDTAGLRDGTDDTIEAAGIERARGELARADCVLWLGAEGQGPAGAWEVAAQSDVPHFVPKGPGAHTVSAVSGDGVAALKESLLAASRTALPKPGDAALNARQHEALALAEQSVSKAQSISDPLLIGEELRLARAALDALIGRTTTEDMLDALFGRFCIGK